MSLIDARSLELPTRLATDVCIVGAGAVGLTLARELARGGRELCLVEAGGLGPDADTQALYDLDSVGYPQRPGHMSRARYFGGSCNLWAGRSMMLGELDLAPRPWVPAGGWPIAHAELARYYPQAAQSLGLAGAEAFDPGSHARRASADERRIFADRDLVPAVSLWAKQPMRFGPSGRRDLERAPGVRVLLNANVTALEVEEAGARVHGVLASTLDGGRIAIAAQTVVLACGGLENARLLLASQAEAGGIGNRHDQVGRCFMDHPRAVSGRVRLRPGVRLALLRNQLLRDGQLQFGIAPSPVAQRERRLLNHYVTFEPEHSTYAQQSYQSFVDTMKVVMRRGHAGSRWQLGRTGESSPAGLIYLLKPSEIMPRPLYRGLLAARRMVPERPRERVMVLVFFCEQPPDPSSRVTLGPDKDRLGMPRLVLNWRIGDAVVDSVHRLRRMLAERLGSLGLGRVEEDDEELRFTDASHHMGTTPMSDDPRMGVVDRDCRVHGIANLYVAGSSVFPTAGHANPTLSALALTHRLARHLSENRE